jgi:hypothetical protein
MYIVVHNALQCSMANKHVIDISIIYLFIIIYLFTCAYIVGSFKPPHPPSPTLSPRSPSVFYEEPVLSLSLILLKKRHKHNKEDKPFFAT